MWLNILAALCAVSASAGVQPLSGSGGSATSLTTPATVTNTNASASSPSLTLTSTGPVSALKIVPQGDTGVNIGTSGSAVLEDCSGTTDICHQIYSNATAAQQGAASLLYINAANTSWSQPVVTIRSDSTLFPNVNLLLQGGLPTLQMRDVNKTSPAGKFQFTDRNDTWRFEGRNAADGAFTDIMILSRSSDAPAAFFGDGTYQTQHTNTQIEVMENSFVRPSDLILAVTTRAFTPAGGIFSINGGGGVGIGNSSLFAAQLFAVGTASLTVLSASGNVGIGIALPTSKLHISSGQLKMDGTGSSALFGSSTPVTMSSMVVVGVSVSSQPSAGAGVATTALCPTGSYATSGGCDCSGAVGETSNVSRPSCIVPGCVPYGWTCQVAGGTGGACISYATCTRLQ